MVSLKAFDNLDSQIGFLSRERRRMTQTHNHLEHTFFNNFFDNLDSQIGFLNRERHGMTQTQIYNHIKHTFFQPTEFPAKSDTMTIERPPFSEQAHMA